MIDVEEIRVRSLDVDYFEVTWKVKSTAEDLLDYTFQLFRSESAAGPWVPISKEMEDQYVYVDNHIRIGHEFRQFHYQIQVREKQTDKTKVFGPASPGPDADLIALELRKHLQLLFREFIGRRCWVLPVRTFGQRCSCWDKTLGSRTRSHCATCFDTGFVYGYMTPIETWISIDPNPNNEQVTNIGPLQQSDTTARTGHFPTLKPRDVIIEPENLRWRVVRMSPTEQVRAPVLQEIQIHKIPSTDIEYKLAIKPDQALKDMWLSPSRNFSNPHNLEAFTDEEFPQVTQLYYSSYPPVRT